MWVVFILLLILVIIIVCIPRKQETKVRLYNEDTGSVYHTGNGFSVGEAMVDLFSKIASYLTDSSRLDTIKSRVDGMERALNDNCYSMRKRDIQICEDYLQQVRDLYNRKFAEDQKRKAALPTPKRFVSKQPKVSGGQKRKAALPAQKRFSIEQRKLMTDGLRYDVFMKDGFRCVICGATAQDGVKLHVDHIIPVSKGGKTEMSNLRTLCERCNLGKSNKIERIPYEIAQNKANKPLTLSPDQFANFANELDRRARK